jgi:hypothetical protein
MTMRRTAGVFCRGCLPWRPRARGVRTDQCGFTRGHGGNDATHEPAFGGGFALHLLAGQDCPSHHTCTRPSCDAVTRSVMAPLRVPARQHGLLSGRERSGTLRDQYGGTVQSSPWDIPVGVGLRSLACQHRRQRPGRSTVAGVWQRGVVYCRTALSLAIAPPHPGMRTRQPAPGLGTGVVF